MFRRELRQVHGPWFGHIRAERKDAVDAIKEAKEMHLHRATHSVRCPAKAGFELIHEICISLLLLSILMPLVVAKGVLCESDHLFVAH
jgi:hypothetical protein